jgi:metal-sulfur cluster biosynthetic enzyme
LGRALHPHAGQPVQPGALDLPADVGLGAAQTDRPALPTHAPSKHGEIDHQGDISESELAHVDDNVALRAKGSGKRRSPPGLRDAVLVSAAAQHGGLFAVIDDPGNLFEIGRALQVQTAEAASSRAPKLLPMVSVNEVNDALREVIDPELGLDFVELGLIYDVEIEEGTVKITYSLTTPACPIGPHVSEQIEEFVGELDGVERVEPTMTFSPPWTPERMSEDAKFALGF